jgi:hypothetical protein
LECKPSGLPIIKAKLKSSPGSCGQDLDGFTLQN